MRPQSTAWRNPWYAPVIFDTAGNLYGTDWGGAGPCACGHLFELSPVGASWTETVLYNCNSEDCMDPMSGVIMDSAGNLYGTQLLGRL